MSLIWIFLILLVVFVSLTVFLWIGTYFFQGYIYTQPSEQLYWQAPAAAFLLTFGYGIWCLSIVMSTGANPQNIPVDTLFRFNAYQDMLDRPAPKLWAIKLDRRKTAAENKEGEAVLFVSKREGQKKFHYEDTTLAHRPWQPYDVLAIEMEKPDGSKIRFEPVKTDPGEIPQYASKDGWVMKEFDTGPTGLPQKFSLGRMILNLFFNFGHLLGWFLGLWVILRFQWAHALGLAFVLWAATTLTVLPMLLTYSGYIASTRQVPTTTVWRSWWLGHG